MGHFGRFVFILLVVSVTTAAYAGEHKPPDFMAEAKRQSDSTTIRKAKFGLSGGVALAIPFGDETYRSELSKARSFSVGLFERARLRKSHLASIAVSLSYYYERFQSDHESIINQFRPWFDFPDTPVQSTGGDRTTTAILIESSICPPWVNRPVLPFARFAIGVGRYKVEDLEATWDDYTFTYLGYDDWILVFGGGLGVKHDFQSGHFVALEVRVQSFSSLTQEGEAIDTPGGPVGPPIEGSTPASIGIHLTAGVAVF
ncbi:MAG: hypothetical protein WBP29_11320 [Candidatus Zixiibacteriota bacterium]